MTPVAALLARSVAHAEPLAVADLVKPQDASKPLRQGLAPNAVADTGGLARPPRSALTAV